MPSLQAYTPYETLTVCQSVAHHGTDAAAFETIALKLNANELIRDHGTYDAARFTASALQRLYQDLIVEEGRAPTRAVNGEPGSPRKRKASPLEPAESSTVSDLQSLESLIEVLYTRFREETIREIRQDEEAFVHLQAEIAELEHHVDDDAPLSKELSSQAEASIVSQSPSQDGSARKVKPRASPDAPSPRPDARGDAPPELPTPRVATPSSDRKGSPSSVRSGQHPPAIAPSPSTPSASGLPPAKSSTEPASSRRGQGRQRPSPESPHNAQPVLPPSPQRPTSSNATLPHPASGPPGQHLPVLTPMPMPPPTDHLKPKRASPSSGPGRGSPIPTPPQPGYPGYPGYVQAPWPPLHMPPQTQFPYGPPHGPPHPPPYATPAYHMQSPPGRAAMPFQTPPPANYQPYLHGGPIPYQGQFPPPPHGWQPPPGQPYYGLAGSPNVTPAPPSTSKQSSLRPRSSTPWKGRSDAAGVTRPSSPTRPERAVSPLSDGEDRPVGARASGAKDLKTAQTGATRREGSGRERTAPTPTPSAVAGSRSQSVTSLASEPATEKRRPGRPSQKIEVEPPSTPISFSPDTDQPQRGPGRRGRPPTALNTSLTGPGRGTTAVKRKRSPGRDSSSPSLRPERPATRAKSAGPESRDASLVLVSKNFVKTSQMLLNDIVSHKLAGIFAKPLSEREAPGYRHMILRPQDLKSIKAAISKGGKAALGAIEALESEDRHSGEASTKKTPDAESRHGERALDNGLYLVNVSEDLTPPRGIVNASQLEMELARIFANAVMFNPLPDAERGFGRSLRLRRYGGDVRRAADSDSDNDNDNDADTLTTSDDGTAVDEGAVVSDAREMFEDVISRVSRFREVEVERLRGGEEGAGGPSTARTPSGVAAVRRSSASSNVAPLDEDGATEGAGKGMSTPAAPSVTGTARKRRRLADHRG